MCHSLPQTPSCSFQNSSICQCNSWLCHRSLQNCQLTVLHWCSCGSKQTTQIVSGLSVIVAHGNCASTDNIKSLESSWNYFIIGTDAPDVYAARWVLFCSPSICFLKAMVLHQETQAVCQNQLISSHWFAEHLKQCCTQNSKRLSQTLVDENDRLRKIASSEEGVCFGRQVRRGLGGAPFVVKPNLPVKRHGPDNEAWSLSFVCHTLQPL